MATSFNGKGMQPVNVFPDSFSSSRFSSQPNSLGISPVNELLLRFRWVSSNNLPNDDGNASAQALRGQQQLGNTAGCASSGDSFPTSDGRGHQSNVAVPRSVSLPSKSASQSCTKLRLVTWTRHRRTVGAVYTPGGCAGVKVAVDPSSGVMSPYAPMSR